MGDWTRTHVAAVAQLQLGGVTGIVTFEQEVTIGSSGGVAVQATVKGLKPGKYAIAIHAFGDLSRGCTSAGPQFNPRGDGYAPPGERRGYGHLADFEVGENDKEVVVASHDDVVSITGPESIIGRSVVVIEVPAPPTAEPTDDGAEGTEDAPEPARPADGVQAHSSELDGERVTAGVIGIARMTAPSVEES